MSREPLHVTLEGERAIRMVRRFQAPRELVFAALTTPALLQRWYAELVSAELDLRVGGDWRIVTRRPDGREIGQRGTYREVEPPERLVRILVVRVGLADIAGEAMHGKVHLC